MSQEPINIAGVCAFPNPNGVRDMRFVDCYYNTLFFLPNHSNIIITKPDGTQMKQQCSYIDDYHTYIGQCGFHIMEFAEIAWRNGYSYLPEHPQEGRGEESAPVAVPEAPVDFTEFRGDLPIWIGSIQKRGM